MNISINKNSFSLTLAILVFTLTGAVNAQTRDLTYKASDGTACLNNLGIHVVLPSGNGPFPVHVHMVGTNANYLAAEAVPIQTEMMGRGFITASIEWDSSTPYTCAAMDNKASCIFDPNSVDSAITKICALPEADCSRGIVVSGMSQGGQIAYISKNYETRVQAVWTMSAGNARTSPPALDFSSCLNPAARQLPANRLRTVSGESDGLFGTTTTGVRNELVGLTNANCGTSAYSCIQSDGSGWYMVSNSEVQDANADHCYMFASGCGSASTSSMDVSWAAPATYAWSMRTNLSWLSSYVTTSGGSGSTAPTQLVEAYAYPNPAVSRDPILHVVLPPVDTVEITIFDVTGRAVHSITLGSTSASTTPSGGQVYEYHWSGSKASGVYIAVIHGRHGSTITKARIKFAVVK